MFDDDQTTNRITSSYGITTTLRTNNYCCGVFLGRYISLDKSGAMANRASPSTVNLRGDRPIVEGDAGYPAKSDGNTDVAAGSGGGERSSYLLETVPDGGVTPTPPVQSLESRSCRSRSSAKSASYSSSCNEFLFIRRRA
jgi:hypothetical protein